MARYISDFVYFILVSFRMFCNDYVVTEKSNTVFYDYLFLLYESVVPKFSFILERYSERKKPFV